MKAIQGAIVQSGMRPWTTSALFAALQFSYVWWIVDPRLVLHALGILTPYQPFFFHTGWPFLQEHLTRVGGLVEYGTRLLTQFYAYGWLGALVITVVACSMGWFAKRLIRRGGAQNVYILPWVPAAILLLMYCGYSHRLSTILSLLIALGAYVLYIRFAPVGFCERIMALLLVEPVLYYIAGAGSLLFAILVAIDELLIGDRKRVATVAIACALVVPWTVGTLFGLDLSVAYTGFPTGAELEQWSYALALNLFFPTVLAGSVLWGHASACKARRGGTAPALLRGRCKVDHLSDQKHHSVTVVTVRTWIVEGMFFCGVGVAVWLSFDSFTRTVLETDYYAQEGRWADVLTAAERMPKGLYNHRCNRNVIQALCHTRRLGDELFRFPQQRVDLFSTPEEHQDVGSSFHESRLFLDIGLVNQAERCAYEALSTSGEQPAILEQLSIIHAVKGRPETAMVFLHALAKHPLHRQSARGMLRQLAADPSMVSDPRISWLRSNMATRDRIMQVTSAEDWLADLLDKNPHNQMAFELLMARYLCDKRPDRVVANFPRLKDFCCSKVPRYYQEALIAHRRSVNQSPSPAPELDPEVVRRAEDFQRIINSASNPQEAVTTALDAGLGDSYFLYLACGISGW